jgi:isoleucyl-tRNA synthetase
VIVASGAEREAIQRMADLVREELNVRELRFVSAADELVEVEVKPNYRSLGPRFGKQMPLVAAAVAALDPAGLSAAIREARTLAIDVGGTEHPLSADDLLISMRPLEGYQLEREGSHAVALETTIDGELRIEGWAREIVHTVQAARREAGLDVSDRIVLTLDGDRDLLEAARSHQQYIAGETLAVDVRYEQDGSPTAATIDGLRLGVGVARADRL